MDEIFEQSDASIKIKTVDVAVSQNEAKAKAPLQRTKTSVVYLQDRCGMVSDEEMESSFHQQEDSEPSP
jgi:hypothetical protein